MAGPLAGYRIIDLSSVLMGPFASTIMGDLGADVIKVESPEGDTSRNVGSGRRPGMPPVFLHANRSKRSLSVNLKTRQGIEIMKKLVPTADVVLSNLRPDTLKKLGLAYDDLVKLKDDIIYCGTYGYGSGGPYEGLPAYDDLIQGAVGIPWLLSRDGSLPKYMPLTLADRVTALTAVYSIVAALLHKERTGLGQAIEVPMFEVMVNFVLSDHLGGESFVPRLGEMGYKRLLSKERRPYKTKDGYICALVYNDKQWNSFAELVGDSVLIEDCRLQDLNSRIENVDYAYGLIADHISQKETAYWIKALDAADIPFSPLNSIQDLLDDDHLSRVNFFVVQEHPSEGVLRTMRPPVRWSRSEPVVEKHAPTLGQDTRWILREQGYSDDEIDKLETEGVVRCNQSREAEPR